MYIKYVLPTDKVDLRTELSGVMSSCDSGALKKDCTKAPIGQEEKMRWPGQPSGPFMFGLRLASVPSTAEHFSKARMLCLS